MVNNKIKTLKVVITAVLVLVAFILLLLGIFIYLTEYRISDIESTMSPNGKYEVIYQNIGEPDFPFGYSHARLVLQHNGKEIIQHRFDVANDGKILGTDNWNVEWKDDRVEVLISGEEQKDIKYTLYFDGNEEVN